MNTDAAKVMELPQGAVYEQEFVVSCRYPVYFTADAFDLDNPVFEQALCQSEPGRRKRFAVFVDANVAACWPALGHQVAAYAGVRSEALELAAPPVPVPGGEQCKNDPALVTRLQQRVDELAIDRHSYVVAIGGGAVLDLVGYVAATSHRGVRHVRLPTTVLAQNDSGVGVKNGVNAFGKKNFLGTFAPPHAVINDASFLRTLHPRDRVAGMAEAVKVALIRDRVFFEWLEASAEALHDNVPAATARMIRRCAELHMRQIGQGGDPGRPTSSSRSPATSCAMARPSRSASRSTRVTRCRPGCCRPARMSVSTVCSSGSGSTSGTRRWSCATRTGACGSSRASRSSASTSAASCP